MTTRGVMVGAVRAATLGLGAALLAAQQQTPQTFRASTRLVEVTVTVVDKKGNAVTGLGPADFTVLDEGKPRAVEVFHFDGGRVTPAPAAVPPTLPPGTFTNRLAPADDGPRNVTALVLDNINTTPVQGVTARAQMMRYLRTLAPQTTTAVYLMAEKLYVLHDFTDDAAALRARVEKATLPNPTGWEMDQRQSVEDAERFVRMFGDDPGTQETMKGFQGFALRAEAMADAGVRRDRALQSLGQIEALGLHLAGIPGRKSVVWIGGGFSMVAVTTSQSQRTPELVETLEGEVRQTSRRLAQQGVALYIVDAHRVDTSPDTRAQTVQPLPQRGRGNFDLILDTAATSNDTRTPMQAMASLTGGRYFYPEDVTAGVDKVVSDWQGSYTLGFYAPEKPDDKWHKLKVQVKRPGLTVRHRDGYLADSQLAKPAKWTDANWRSAFSNPLGSSAIPLTVACRRMESGDVAVRVLADTGSLKFQPEGENLKAELEILVGDRSPDGLTRASRSGLTRTVPVDRWDAARLQPTGHELTWKPAAGVTTLRVVVHDVNSGQHGSLDVPLAKVPRNRPN
jgi:VWFA-related protein